jgi:hypothetical protein
VKKKKRLKQLAWREYLPLAATAATWALIVIAIGHADTARLLAAAVLIRAIQMLTRLTTSTGLRRRMNAPAPIRRQARLFAFNLQAAALIVSLLLLAVAIEGLTAIGQGLIAAFLPYMALGMPARHLRFSDVRTSSPYFRLALSGGGLALVLLGWALGFQAVGMAFAFGARQWIAYAVLRWWPRTPMQPANPLSEPLTFGEVARTSAVVGRRLLTYRLTKVALTLFGPVGNLAARTGRGLNWHHKIEPYIPHHLGGFILFSAGSFGAAAFLAIRSGEPAAMILAAGLCQIGAAALNIVMFWRWLPPGGGELSPDDEDDE